MYNQSMNTGTFYIVSGDVTGWQTAYLYEVMKRHNDEREQLLKYLQDEAITELMEAASEMLPGERKARLAELQGKRRRLDLTNLGLSTNTFFTFIKKNSKTL